MTEANTGYRDPRWSGVPAEPGLCRDCRNALLNQTRRGTTYLRCGRAAWDERMRRYPPLPVTGCAGHEPLPGAGD